MALTKDHHQIPSRPFYENMVEVGSSIQFPHISSYSFDEYDQQQDEDSLESPNSNIKVMISTNQVIRDYSPPISSSSSANSSNNSLTIHHHASNYQPHEEAQDSLINFKSGYGSFMDSSNGSLISFQNEINQVSHLVNHHHYPIWDGNYSISNISNINHHHHQQQQQQSHELKEMKNCTSNMNLLEEVNHLRTSISDCNQDLAANEWIYAEAKVIDPPQESATQQTCFNKRPNMEEENMQAPKKQCTTSTSKKFAKPKSVPKLKDPQSVAAKNRRERISERLKILQDLVPNGSKVDLVTMLEKAIGYVKFLQLQLKVLATDEFWPAAGGNAPDISQVREAIDAILSSQRSSQGTISSSS